MHADLGRGDDAEPHAVAADAQNAHLDALSDHDRLVAATCEYEHDSLLVTRCRR